MKPTIEHRVTQITPSLIRVIAPNPSAMTFWGTNCYILGDSDERVLIDPGPNDLDHLNLLLKCLPDRTHISHIFVTHAHLDHSEGAAQMALLSGAQLYAFGDATMGKHEQMMALEHAGVSGGGEGVDHKFRPDVILKHQESLHTPAGTITALHTPGHMGNHMCFAWNDVLFSGDLIMGWSSSLISPPDGDAAAFRSSCNMLLDRPTAQQMQWRFYPGHGDFIVDGQARIRTLLEHRKLREDQILQTLQGTGAAQHSMCLSDITAHVYDGIDPRALHAASRNCFAHLIDLANRNIVLAHPHLSQEAKFSLKEYD